MYPQLLSFCYSVHLGVQDTERYFVIAPKEDFEGMAGPPHGRSLVANQDFDPTKRQRRVLDVFKQEYQVNPRRIREVTGIEKQRVNDELDALRNAGWVEKRARGLYRLIYDGECYVEQTIHCKDDDPRRQR